MREPMEIFIRIENRLIPHVASSTRDPVGYDRSSDYSFQRNDNCILMKQFNWTPGRISGATPDEKIFEFE